MADSEFKSVVDLLDTFFGTDLWSGESVDLLNDDDLDALAVDVDAFYAAYDTPKVKADQLRTYSGGSIFTPDMKPQANSQPRIAPDSHLLGFAHATALYVDQIVINCPLDAWIFSYRDFLQPRPFRASNGMMIELMSAHSVYGNGYRNAQADENRAQIKQALSRLGILSRAVRQGWIIPVPHLRMWKRRLESIRTQVRHDIMNPSLMGVLSSEFEIPPAQSDIMRGMQVHFGTGATLPQDYAHSVIESPMIYFNSSLAVAGDTDARFLPTSDSDFAILRQRLTDAGNLNRQLRDVVAVGSLRRTLLPTFDDATFATICKIRDSEESFHAWRNEIRALADGDALIPDQKMAAYESILDERIQSHVAKIDADIEKSPSLKSKIATIRPGKLDIGLAAAIWLVPPEGSITKLIAAIAAPILKAAVTSFRSPSGTSRSVVMELRKV